MTPARILWVDPGKMTGFGVLSVGGHGISFIGAELAHDPFIDWAANALRTPASLTPWGADIGTLTAVGYEGFNIGPRTVQQAPDDRSMWSVKQIGILETFARWAQLPTIRQMPADKSFGTDDKLKALGWYAPAPGLKGEAGHRRDAARHALKYAVDHQLIDLRSLLA